MGKFQWVYFPTLAAVSSSSSSPAIPPPPPGFSKAHVETTPTSTTAGIGTGNGNQTTTTAASINPMLLANSKGRIVGWGVACPLFMNPICCSKLAFVVADMLLRSTGFCFMCTLLPSPSRSPLFPSSLLPSPSFNGILPSTSPPSLPTHPRSLLSLLHSPSSTLPPSLSLLSPPSLSGPFFSVLPSPPNPGFFLPLLHPPLPRSLLSLLSLPGQFLPNHLLQSWSNLRNLAKLTPAQQQQLARTNQLTFQQQQLLAHQYLFQQALMRNPALQAQSLRMAQQFQRAALLQQQQQQQALIAGLKAAGTAPSSTVNPTCTAQNAGSVSMATGMTSAPTTSVSASASQSASKAAAGGDPSVPSKLGSKAPHPNATNSGLKGHSTSGRSSGQNSARGFSSGHSKNSSQVTSSNSSGQSNPPVVLTSRSSGDNKHHHPRNSKSAKPKSGGGVHHPAITVLDRKTRQKLSK